MRTPLPVDRRSFLKLGGGVVAAGGALGAWPDGARAQAPAKAPPIAPADPWVRVRASFELDPTWNHMAGFLFAPHPKPVRDEIEKWRRMFDSNPALTVETHMIERSTAVRAAAAAFLGADPSEVALTGSTTEGLGIVYGGFRLKRGDEILTTAYDHFSSHETLRMRARRDDIAVKKVELFAHSAKADAGEIVEKLMAGVTARTRLVAITWVHSMSGVKLPIRAIADALAKKNAGRAEADRALLCVDGVHGFGVDPVNVREMGADFFIAGTHKWIFGPRGTGLVWGTPAAWARVVATTAPFELEPFMAWMQGKSTDATPPGPLHTAGGFHTYEARWALPAAFAFQDAIGRDAISARIHALNRQLKEGLAKMSKVELFTPMDDALSAGQTCFMIQGVTPQDVVKRMHAKKIFATTTPYVNVYARLAPGLLNTPAEVDAALAEVRAIAGA